MLDEWLRRHASQNRRRDTAATWVIADANDVAVAAPGNQKRRKARACGGGVVAPAESSTPSGVRPLLRVALQSEAAAGCERCSLGELG